MQQPKSYKTKQRDVIINALRQLNGHTTAEALVAHLHQNGQVVGLATVYRNLDKLVNEGAVLKYTLPEGLSACYQYLDACGGEKGHSHLICTQCGGVTHLACEAVNTFATHLQQQHGYVLDKHKTVFYGRCARCAGNAAVAKGCAHQHK